MRLTELIARTGIAERQVRYLISEGFIPSPSGGRSNADYGEAHVAGIRRYMRLRELGFPPAAIKLLLYSHPPVAERIAEARTRQLSSRQ